MVSKRSIPSAAPALGLRMAEGSVRYEDRVRIGCEHLVHFIHHDPLACLMAYKYTSDLFQISALAAEATPNTLVTETINVSLDSLSREILVIEYVDIDVSPPEVLTATKTQMNCTLRDNDGGVAGLSNPRTIATANITVSAAGPGDVAVFQNAEPKTANMMDGALYVTATDNLFLSVQGANNAGVVGLGQVRIFARRAKADADTYAAILTSQYN